MITLKDIQKNESIQALVHAGNHYLSVMGFTDHGPRHLGYVSHTASKLLRARRRALWHKEEAPSSE